MSVNGQWVSYCSGHLANLQRRSSSRLKVAENCHFPKPRYELSTQSGNSQIGRADVQRGVEAPAQLSAQVVLIAGLGDTAQGLNDSMTFSQHSLYLVTSSALTPIPT